MLMSSSLTFLNLCFLVLFSLQDSIGSILGSCSISFSIASMSLSSSWSSLRLSASSICRVSFLCQLGDVNCAYFFISIKKDIRRAISYDVICFSVMSQFCDIRNELWLLNFELLLNFKITRNCKILQQMSGAICHCTNQQYFVCIDLKEKCCSTKYILFFGSEETNCSQKFLIAVITVFVSSALVCTTEKFALTLSFRWNEIPGRT